jgi:DNA repair protein RecO (recombination protein O)
LKELTPAFILHTRSYRETSLIVDFFTLEHGRLSAVARGARGSKKKGTLQPFMPFMISLAGAGELKTLRSYEIDQGQINLSGHNLLIGLYVNELLVRLLGRFDPMTRLFDSYRELVLRLSKQQALAEGFLRCFEFNLLAELGYGIVFDYEIATGRAISEEGYYRYSLEEGFLPVSSKLEPDQVFLGRDLLAIGRIDFSLPSTTMTAKKIVRLALQPLLGSKPLNSRELFIRPETIDQ